MEENPKVDHIEYSFTGGGLLYSLLAKVGLTSLVGWPGVRALAAVAITYLPILVLASIEGVAWGQSVRMPLLCDITETCRFLLVGPLLIASEAFVDPWIIQSVRYVRDRLTVRDELPRFEKSIAKAVRLRDSYFVEFFLLIGVFGWQWVEVSVVPHNAMTSWHCVPSGESPTNAYLWCVYISRPLVRFLWFRWIWRYLVWSLFLVRLARMKLNIVPTHPDKLGGLGIIAAGHRQFTILALTFGVQAASIVGEQIIFEGKKLLSFKEEVIGVVIIVLLFFLTPLLTFTGKLLEAKRIGLFEYGAFAEQVTSAFHTKWIGSVKEKEQVLATGEVQSLSNLANTYQVVRNMSISLIGKDNALAFVLATLLPFVPLLLTVYPFEELVKHVLKVVI